MYFEDFAPGMRFTTASRQITEAEIIDFASQWDRQPFHLDRAAAAQSIYGGIIASGFHTLVVSFDLIVGAGVWNESSQGSPGMDEVRWLRPVRPGDSLTVEFEVLETRPSTSRADRGYVRWSHVTRNQDGEEVMSFRSTGISLKRSPA